MDSIDAMWYHDKPQVNTSPSTESNVRQQNSSFASNEEPHAKKPRFLVRYNTEEAVAMAFDSIEE